MIPCHLTWKSAMYVNVQLSTYVPHVLAFRVTELENMGHLGRGVDRRHIQNMVEKLAYSDWLILYYLAQVKSSYMYIWESKNQFEFCQIKVWPDLNVQGVVFEILLLQMAVAHYWWSSDSKLAKPKCVWEVAVFYAKRIFFKKTFKMKNFSKSIFFISP